MPESQSQVIVHLGIVSARLAKEQLGSITPIALLVKITRGDLLKKLWELPTTTRDQSMLARENP